MESFDVQRIHTKIATHEKTVNATAEGNAPHQNAIAKAMHWMLNRHKTVTPMCRVCERFKSRVPQLWRFPFTMADATTTSITTRATQGAASSALRSHVESLTLINSSSIYLLLYFKRVKSTQSTRNIFFWVCIIVVILDEYLFIDDVIVPGLTNCLDV